MNGQDSTTNPYYGIRFLIIEETPVGDTVLEEYDIEPGQANEMRKNLQAQVDSMRASSPDKCYRLQEETINDGTQEV